MRVLRSVVTAAVVSGLLVLAPAAYASDRSQSLNGDAGPGATDARRVVDVGSGWIDFTFEGSGDRSGPWVFTSDRPVDISITDAHCSGDEFRALVAGDTEVVGNTSEVATRVDCSRPVIANPSVATHLPVYSHGSFRVGPGSHVLWIQVTESPFTSGAAYFRIDAATR